MTKFTIELADSHVVTSRGKHVTIDVTKLSADIVARLVTHGLTQKVADAAASAKNAAGEGATDEAIADAGLALMSKVADSLMAGEWGVERGGNGVTALHAEMRTVIRPKVKAKFGADDWKTMDEKERVSHIDATIAKLTDAQRDIVTAAAQEALDRKAAEAAKAKAIAAKLGDLDI